ncbi:MAG: hypothetical protein J6J18_08675 [Oscillospiraceae bacterium]|nr:hypothetical protein [Oscillospiraceae bacterium]
MGRKHTVALAFLYADVALFLCKFHAEKWFCGPQDCIRLTEATKPKGSLQRKRWGLGALSVGELVLSKKVKYFDAREFVNQKIEERTYIALHQKNAQFAQEHANDSKEQLLEYLRQQAQQLGKTPNMDEIIGGPYIGYRFDGYINAVSAAGLSFPRRSPESKARKIYRDEYKNQARLYREEKAAAKARKAEEREVQAKISQEETAARKERDQLWGEEHRNDTDEQLMEYVKHCAEELGHTPFAREVVGGEYIRKRFDGWTVMLVLADIPLDASMKRPPDKKIKEYLNKRKNLA